MSVQNNNPKGIVFILIAMIVFSVQDGIMKHIYNFVSLYEIYLIRTVVSFLLILFFLIITKKPIVFKTQYPLLTFTRVILFFFGFSSFYVSLTVLPLGTATALFFVTPFLITIFAHFFLKEEIGLRRWSAVVVGFIGVYVTLNPDFSNFNYLSLLPILCALCYSLSMIIIKKTSDKDSVYTQTFTFYIGAIIISIIFYFIIGDGQYNVSDHPASQFIFREWFVDFNSNILLMTATGVTATAAFLFLFKAYSIASPAVVSPFEYSILFWSPLVGWLYFDEIPSLNTVFGILIIVCSGVYIFMREKAQNQSIATEKPLR
ncbi:DMT family transporter [Candidatus Pelagibacter communis]|uniref:DMT family transporter n=1 Tax=Pelagibacter ubique TaxID=198252 RepID=UPI00094CDDBF|nr:DMT family transporter [Candidatus Pelagibacter ubique]